MKNSIVQQNFIDYCKQIHPDVNPYIFIHRHARYSEEYLPLLDKIMKAMYTYIHQKKPNVDFSLKGRIKSERSYLNKTYITMCENIKHIFDNEQEEVERNKMFQKYFKFLLCDNPLKYEELEKKTKTITPAFDYIDSFPIIFNKLSKDEKDKLIYRLGRTEDTFAYRLITHSVDFPIKSIHVSSDSKFYIIDQDGNNIPINVAVTLNPEKDILRSKENNKYYTFINGEKENLNERNLLYPSNLSNNQRRIENAQKDKNGNLTLLGDSFIFNDNSYLDIIDIKLNPNNNSIFITVSNGETRNISSLLEKGNLKLRKHDEKSLIKEVYDIFEIVQDFYKTYNIQSIPSRYKDYIKFSKPISDYMSLHDSAFNIDHGYTIEGQNRTLKMEDDSKDESTRVGHDSYKQSELEKYYKNKFLAKILEKDPTAFDSSNPTIMQLLSNENIDLSEVLGKYILISKTSNSVIQSFQPTIDMVFEHIFRNVKMQPSLDDNLPQLDFSSYENFIISKRHRNNAIMKESNFPDIYDE